MINHSRLMDKLQPFLTKESSPGKGSFLSISINGIKEAAVELGCSQLKAMAYLLEMDIWPLRFARNRGSLSSKEQARLILSKVAVVGCGGLGGWVLTFLARLGVGSFNICDGDFFSESNLNRQAFCSEYNLGKNKALSAKNELLKFASHLCIVPYDSYITPNNIDEFLEGCCCVIDCLDNLQSRRLVSNAAKKNNILFIHGAVSGYEGFSFVENFTQNESALDKIYPEGSKIESFSEEITGVISLTPPAIALIQCKLALDSILESGERHKDILYHLDLAVPELEKLLL